jgi:general secretion pathway protein L
MSATTEALPAKAATPAWRQKSTAFWRWWGGELQQAMPAWLARMPGVSRGALIALEGDEIVLLDARGGHVAETARVPIGSLDPEGRRMRLRELLVRAQESANSVRIALSHDEVLVRRARLPLATEENLAQVLAFEMDRLTPFKSEDVYFDHRIVQRDVAGGRLEIDLAVARRSLVDERVAALQDLGAAVQGVTLRDEAGRSGALLDLLPREQRGARKAMDDRRIAWALAALVAVLFVVALCLPWWQKRQAVIAIMPAVEKARLEAEATDKLARELERMVADYNFLLAKKHASSRALEVVEELSRLLPDTTWVQQLDLRTQGKVREVQISGETPSSSKLIELLEGSTVLQNTAPRGAITKGSQPGTERFLIAIEVRPKPLPEALPVASMIAPAPPAPRVPPPPAATPATPVTPTQTAPATPTQTAPATPAQTAPATPAQTVKPAASADTPQN